MGGTGNQNIFPLLILSTTTTLMQTDAVDANQECGSGLEALVKVPVKVYS